MRIVIGGDEAFNAIAFGTKSQRQFDVLQNHLTQAGEWATARAGSFGQSFFDGAMADFEISRSDTTLELARMAVNQVSGVYQHDVVRSINTLEGFQIATPVMQRWLMAEPTVRELYHQQRLDGWSDTYVDHAPGKVGEDHYEWRRVNSGIVKFTDDGWYCDEYSEELYEPDDELSHSDQVRIMRSQDWLKALALQAMKDSTTDPTNAWDVEL